MVKFRFCAVFANLSSKMSFNLMEKLFIFERVMILLNKNK